MMMEDWVSYNLNPAFNNVRDERAPNYVLEQSSNCSLINFDVTSTTCDSYSVNGSFGGFLDRQLGLAFFKDLLYRVDNVDSLTVLDEAIRAANPSTSVADAFTRFSVSLGALVPATKAPPGYNFPARSESGYTLAAIDPAAYTKQLPATPVTAVTASINPFAAIPVTRASGSGTYARRRAGTAWGHVVGGDLLIVQRRAAVELPPCDTTWRIGARLRASTPRRVRETIEIVQRVQPLSSGQADEVSFPLYGGIGNFNAFKNLHGHARNDIFNACTSTLISAVNDALTCRDLPDRST